MPKRKRENDGSCHRRIRRVPEIISGIRNLHTVQHPILDLCYRRVCSLGDFLLDRLSHHSRNRRKKLRSFDVDFPQHFGFLNRILIGVTADPSSEVLDTRLKDFVSFTQRQCSGSENSPEKPIYDLDAILDFAIWLIFRRDTISSKGPSHLLCQGFLKSTSQGSKHDGTQQWRIPGIAQVDADTNLHIFKQPEWKKIANLLGRDMETIMLNLLLDCGIFQRLGAGRDNLCQISGEPIFAIHNEQETSWKALASNKVNQPSQIKFVRNRMMYAKASINGQGNVQLGLKHIHALNRYNNTSDSKHDMRIMQYIFPRQHRLHNVFTSRVNPKETAQLFQDYTLREQEISTLNGFTKSKTPRRLRGGATRVVHKLRQRHAQCSYTQLLRHYCPLISSSLPETITSPTDSSLLSTTPDKFNTQFQVSGNDSSRDTALSTEPGTSLIPHATPMSQVSAFCQAVFVALIPRDMLGRGEDGNHNWKCLLGHVDRFIKMQRFESTTLHEVCQPLRMKCIQWLRPVSVHQSNKLSATDTAKRLEILQELIYYLFDSVLIPLIRSNFYVTETSACRNRLFYFRHDVWKKMVEPSLATLRIAMFEPLNSRQVRSSLKSNSLGCSHMRLLPKEHGIRPITNLRRKDMKVVNGKRVLGMSVNAQLGPVFSVLNLEKNRQPEALASAMFSVGEIQSRLSEFKKKISGVSPVTFYFAKVDIRSCFDTIPQDQLFEIVDKLILEKEYQTAKHVEVKRAVATSSNQSKKLAQRWITRARLTYDDTCFSLDMAEQLVGNKRRTVFVSAGQQRAVHIESIRKLLQDHLKRNTVKIGRKHFRQVEGIPQGSVLSSLLCSLFFGDFERRKLRFMDSKSSLLLRLIDDFLFITTDESQAQKFVQAMSEASLEHGICINTEKSLVNFEMSLNGHKIPRLHGAHDFQYCGLKIDTQTLQLRKDRDSKDTHVENGLTTDHAGRVGSVFQHRICSSLRLQMHAMFFGSSLNSRRQVLISVFECLVESGMKMHRYRSALPKSKRPTTGFLINLCGQMMNLAFRLCRKARPQDRAFISESQMYWIGAAALSKVLGKKQSDYQDLLQWLRSIESHARQSMNMGDEEIELLMSDSLQSFAKHVY